MRDAREAWKRVRVVQALEGIRQGDCDQYHLVPDLGISTGPGIRVHSGDLRSREAGRSDLASTVRGHKGGQREMHGKGLVEGVLLGREALGSHLVFADLGV